MDTLRIHHLTARYRLTPSARVEREQLDKILGTVLEEALEQALFRVGIAEHEEICIRQLYVPVRLRLSKPESALVLTWSVALAEAIKQAAEQGRSTDVVRYGSCVQALLDLAVSIARGDYGRAWAWGQLGLWRAGAQPSEREALHGFVQALSAESQFISPLLRALANLKQLEFFIARLEEQQWMILAHAALLAAGAPTSLLDLDDEELRESPPPTSALVRQTAHHLLAVSALTKPFMNLVMASLTARRAVAILIVLETDPNTLRASEEASQVLLDTVGEALEILATIAVAQARENQASNTATKGATSATRRSPTTGEEGEAVARDDTSITAEAATKTISGSVTERRALEEEPALTHGRYADEYGVHPEELASDTVEEFPLPLVRRLAPTRFGGLLFLLGVMEDLGLPDEIRTHPVFTNRLSRWVLHQLALALVPAEPHDPVVLAFTGLPPDAAPPSSEEEPPTEAEATAIASYAARLREAVRERLDRRDPYEALQFVCYRHATIVADPGWIEVHFALVDLSTEIRRAALDLNPDYLLWLGVVVKFVYE